MRDRVVNFYNGDTLVATVTIQADSGDGLPIAAIAREVIMGAEASVDGERFSPAEIDEWWA